MIIPGFGIISHVIGTMSDKSVFGQCGPKRKIYKFVFFFSQQTICRKLIDIQSWISDFYSFVWYKLYFSNWISKIQNTMNVSNIFYSFLVKIFVFFNNPQITNARVYNILNIFKILNIFNISNISMFRIKEFFEQSMLVGISEAIRLLLTYILYDIDLNILKKNISYFLFSNSHFVPGKSPYRIPLSWVGTREGRGHGRVTDVKNSAFLCNIESRLIIFKRKYSHNVNSNSFNEWLAGIIDGDGCFLLSKKGYASLEITIQLRDVRCLNIIKQKFGGSIKVRANQNHLRYRLHHKLGLIYLISEINGLIRNPIRLLQLSKICEKYEILINYPKPLDYNNGWLAGFFDSEGSIYLNLLSDQMFITVSQKNKLLLDPLIQLYGGSIYLSKEKENFEWVVYKKQEIFDLLYYFKKYQPKSAKLARLNLIPKYYELKSLGAHKASVESVLGIAWKHFIIKWNKWNSFHDKE